jgi:hypothetical protein
MLLRLVLIVLAGACFEGIPLQAQNTRDEVRDAMRRAVTFFRQHASAGGGYIFQVSADLSKREGEGKVGPTTAWIEPPATPSVGMAYLEAYQRCGEPLLLDAAKETAGALLRGQMRSGGWTEQIEFYPSDRRKYAYRVEPDDGRKRRDVTTFDDDKSQSAIRFLMRLDQELEFNEAAIHEAVEYALGAVLKSQYTNGAWPQRITDPNQSFDVPVLKASFPETWSRTYPKTKYSDYYTLNDGTISDLIGMMLDAYEIYGDERYLASALRGGDFLLLAQLPEPQPGWAQQYDRQMHPAWARKFEPAAITGGESQGAMRTLLLLYRRTAAIHEDAVRFLEPLPRAIAYYQRSRLDDGRLARFYEIGTNRPLFLTKAYELTYSSDDMPTHYGFIVSSKLDQIERELTKVRQTPKDRLWQSNKRPAAVKRSRKLDERVENMIADLDSRGAWVEPGQMRYHGDDDPVRQVIRSQTFIENLNELADWLSAEAE